MKLNSINYGDKEVANFIGIVIGMKNNVVRASFDSASYFVVLMVLAISASMRIVMA